MRMYLPTQWQGAYPQTVGTVTFSVPPGVGLYDCGPGAASASDGSVPGGTLVASLHGGPVAIPVPANGFTDERFAILTDEHFETRGAVTAKFAWASGLVAAGSQPTAEDVAELHPLPELFSVEFVPADDKLDLKGIPDRDSYGELLVRKNPDGTNESSNIVNGALMQPMFKGGDMFFPDAKIDKPGLGRNIVRVCAKVRGMKEGDPVYFRSFDVADPLKVKKKKEDPEPRGNDNNGSVAADHHTPVSSKGDGFAGQLRAVNANASKKDLLDGWGEAGKTTKAEVKTITIEGKDVLVAEVDLLTSFCPGDNFRVVATTAEGRIRMQAWCRKRILTSQRKAESERIIARLTLRISFPSGDTSMSRTTS